MASTETYTSEQELRSLHKGLNEEQLINIIVNQHHTIRELSKNITVTHCCMELPCDSCEGTGTTNFTDCNDCSGMGYN